MLKFPEILSWRHTKTKVTFNIKENAMPIFRSKRKVPVVAEASISKESDCLE